MTRVERLIRRPQHAGKADFGIGRADHGPTTSIRLPIVLAAVITHVVGNWLTMLVRLSAKLNIGKARCEVPRCPAYPPARAIQNP